MLRLQFTVRNFSAAAALNVYWLFSHDRVITALLRRNLLSRYKLSSFADNSSAARFRVAIEITWTGHNGALFWFFLSTGKSYTCDTIPYMYVSDCWHLIPQKVPVKTTWLAQQHCWSPGLAVVWEILCVTVSVLHSRCCAYCWRYRQLKYDQTVWNNCCGLVWSCDKCDK